ncbi:carbon storage regulator [Zavarzinella formosa]|uniref:carbon storage regulator n=1 Tax=Zavarzinella formosa TaxID=360055 RepID=UPI000316FC8F|nr:carbon storage regulator [Zavarzinella formosa]
MLVLTRRIGEEIIIGNNIRVKIVAVKGDRIRVGIDAPNDVPVDRAEIHSRRLEFQLAPTTSNQTIGSIADDSHHLEADVPLGVMPVSHNSTEETLIH